MRYCTGFVLALVAAGCGDRDDGNTSTPAVPGTSLHSSLSRETDPQVDDATLNRLVSDDQTFAASSYAAIDPGNNVVIYSPYGVSSVMAMIYAASAGSTTTTIATQLDFTLPEVQMHPARNKLEGLLTSRNADGITLTVLNQLWSFRESLTFAPDFLDTLAVNYGADVRLLTGAPEDNRQKINQWASDTTHGRITELFPQGSLDDAVFAATDAIYFKGLWAKQFETSATSDAPFTLSDSSQVNVSTMHGDVSAEAIIESLVTAIDIPYKGGTLSLLVVQPKSFATYHLDTAELQRLLGELSGDELVTLALPKFTGSSSYSLAHTLGIDGGDFSRGAPGYSDEGFKLFQSAFVLVDESGTEAAAATGGSVNDSAASETVSITIDHPFYYAVRDRGTGEILFMGTVRDPR